MRISTNRQRKFRLAINLLSLILILFASCEAGDDFSIAVKAPQHINISNGPAVEQSEQLQWITTEAPPKLNRQPPPQAVAKRQPLDRPVRTFQSIFASAGDSLDGVEPPPGPPPGANRPPDKGEGNLGDWCSHNEECVVKKSHCFTSSNRYMGICKCINNYEPNHGECKRDPDSDPDEPIHIPPPPPPEREHHEGTLEADEPSEDLPYQEDPEPNDPETRPESGDSDDYSSRHDKFRRLLEFIMYRLEALGGEKSKKTGYDEDLRPPPARNHKIPSEQAQNVRRTKTQPPSLVLRRTTTASPVPPPDLPHARLPDWRVGTPSPIMAEGPNSTAPSWAIWLQKDPFATTSREPETTPPPPPTPPPTPRPRPAPPRATAASAQRRPAPARVSQQRQKQLDFSTELQRSQAGGPNQKYLQELQRQEALLEHKRLMLEKQERDLIAAINNRIHTSARRPQPNPELREPLVAPPAPSRLQMLPTRPMRPIYTIDELPLARTSGKLPSLSASQQFSPQSHSQSQSSRQFLAAPAPQLSSDSALQTLAGSASLSIGNMRAMQELRQRLPPESFARLAQGMPLHAPKPPTAPRQPPPLEHRQLEMPDIETLLAAARIPPGAGGSEPVLKIKPSELETIVRDSVEKVVKSYLPALIAQSYNPIQPVQQHRQTDSLTLAANYSDAAPLANLPSLPEVGPTQLSQYLLQQPSSNAGSNNRLLQ